MRPGFRQRVAAVQGLLAASLLAVAWPADAADPAVRVVLERAAGAVRLQLPDHSMLRVDFGPGGGLRVGSRASGPIWESSRRGLHRFGEWTIDGRLRVVRRGGTLLVIALVPLERYVEGAVGREMPTSWQHEALMAQAVVSRTYALRAIGEPADPDYDVEATTTSQVFGGVAAVAPSVRRAVRDTHGEYLVYRGRPILAVFHSASGGRTAAAEEVWGDSLPYLRSLVVEDEDEAPSTYWRAAVSRTTLRRALRQLGLDVGRNLELSVSERWPSGRVKDLELRGTRGRRQLSGELLRKALGPDVVKSTLFEVREHGRDVVFVGSGHGHGVGMSQWGAKAMAMRGKNHQEILATFYPGTTLVRVAPRRTAAAGQPGRTSQGSRSGTMGGGER